MKWTISRRRPVTAVVIPLSSMLRDFTLAIELHEHVILYHCNYAPPVPNCGGYFGRVFPDGGLFGKTFSELKSLGTGVHDIQLNAKQQTPKGTAPDWDDDRNEFELFRFVIFGYQHGVFTRTELLMRALLAYRPTFADDVRKLAPDFTMESMRDYASRIPADLSTRAPDDFTFFSSSGHTTRIPDANLEFLRCTLCEKAG